MQKEQIKKIYSRYSPVYDVIFAQLFSPRIRLGLEKIGIREGDRVIEVGVGTGLSLPLKNGNIVIINHFCSNNLFLSKLENFISPVSMKIGWRYGVSTDLLSNHCNLHIEEIFKKNRLDPWRIIHARNKK